MFYSNELLSKRDSGFGLLWLAATLGSKSTLKKLTKKSVLTADISLLCEQIGQPAEPLALRLSSNLMVGVARVYKLKHEIFVTDVTTVYSTLKNTNLGSQTARVVDPKSLQMKKSTAAFDKITMDVDPEDFLDLGRAFGFDWDVQRTGVSDADSMVDSSRRSRSLEANRAQHTIDESHLQSSSLDDAFDPYDYFDVVNAIGESSAHIDLELDLGLDWDAGPQQVTDAEFNMEGVEMSGAPEFDGPDYQPMGDEMGFSLQPDAVANNGDVARSDTWRSHSPSAQKRSRSEDREDHASPRSILRVGPLSDIGNVLQERSSFQEGDFFLADADVNAPEGSINVLVNEEDRAVTPKPKRAKKQVRILLDARTELTDKELKDARDNYLIEQARLQLEIDEQRYHKETAERVHDLLYAPPAMFQAEPLRELWTATFLAQIETKTGAITLVAEPRKRVRKRRRIEEADVGVEEERGQQGQVDAAPVMGNDEGFIDAEQGMFFGGDEFGPMNDEMLPFNLEQSRIRSSEEPEQARNAPSRAQSVHSLEIYRGKDADFGSQHSLLPWDNAAASSSLNEGFAASLGSRGSGGRSIEPDIADTNLALRSLSGSRRGSLGSKEPGSPAIPASLADAPFDDFRLPVGDDQGEPYVATQVSAETLERNSLNFLAFAKMQQHAQNDALTLDDLVFSVRTPHGVANAFYCCLGA